MGQNKKLGFVSELHLIHCGFCSQALEHPWPARDVWWKSLLSLECRTVGSGADEGKGGGGRSQRRSLSLCSVRKTRCHHRQRMTGAGARRNAFSSFVRVYF